MDEQARVREMVANQLGFQLLTLCELNARLEAQAAKLAEVTKERDELKAGASGS